MNRADIHNGGFRARSEYGDYFAQTAGSTAEASGDWVDRDTEASGMANSAKLVIVYDTTLGDTETLSLAVNIQDATASDGSGNADFGTALTNTQVAVSDGGTTETGTIELDFDLTAANQFVRCQITPTLSAANTDTVRIMATWIFFGGDRAPMTKSLI